APDTYPAGAAHVCTVTAGLPKPSPSASRYQVGITPLSTTPLQSLSMPSQTSGVGVPATHESRTAPATHEVVPVDAQAPTPQLVATDTYPSSACPLQFSSIPLQLVSAAPGWTPGFASLQSPAFDTYPAGAEHAGTVTAG